MNSNIAAYSTHGTEGHPTLACCGIVGDNTRPSERLGRQACTNRDGSIKTTIFPDGGDAERVLSVARVGQHNRAKHGFTGPCSVFVDTDIKGRPCQHRLNGDVDGIAHRFVGG